MVRASGLRAASLRATPSGERRRKRGGQTPVGEAKAPLGHDPRMITFPRRGEAGSPAPLTRPHRRGAVPGQCLEFGALRNQAACPRHGRSGKNASRLIDACRPGVMGLEVPDATAGTAETFFHAVLASRRCLLSIRRSACSSTVRTRGNQRPLRWGSWGQQSQYLPQIAAVRRRIRPVGAGSGSEPLLSRLARGIGRRIPLRS